jgi:DNA-directed RNA polymerase sigma subunit (sigma70/sigma32)
MDEAALRRYLEEASAREPLARDVERSLIERAAAGDPAARSALIASGTPFVVAEAGAFADRGLDHSELIEAGHRGLERAVDRVDPSKEVRFTTWATWWIRRAIALDLAQGGTP